LAREHVLAEGEHVHAIKAKGKNQKAKTKRQKAKGQKNVADSLPAPRHPFEGSCNSKRAPTKTVAPGSALCPLPFGFCLLP
jgi:hypothetical protein